MKSRSITLTIRSTSLLRTISCVVWAGVAACLTGCREEVKGFNSFIPTPGAARSAVVATMEAWRRGEPPDSVVSKSPTVNVVDKQRKPGQPLKQYTILGEVSAENARGFAVKLTLDGVEESPVARYLVVGTDPIWVFRQEDYDMISHWMHTMKEPDDRSAGPEPTP